MHYPGGHHGGLPPAPASAAPQEAGASSDALSTDREAGAASTRRLRVGPAWESDDLSISWVRLDDLQPALSRLRREGPTNDALESYAEALRSVTGACLIQLLRLCEGTTWLAGQPHGHPLQTSEVQAIVSKLREAVPDLAQARLARLSAGSAAHITSNGSIGTLLALPLRDDAVGPEAALLLGWEAGGACASDDDGAVLRTVADQLTWALVAGTLANPPTSQSGQPPPSSSGSAPVTAASGSTSVTAPAVTSGTSPRRDPLMGFVAHELRTPLTPIMMLLQSIERRARSGNVDFDALARTRRQTLRMARMIGDMVDLSRILDNALDLDRTSFDVLELTTEVLDTLRPTMPKHRIELAPSAHAMISADRARLERVISNLLEQTERLVPSGGILFASVSTAPPDRPPTIQIRFGARVENAAAGPSSAAPVLELAPPNPSFAQLRGPVLGIFLAEAIAKAHGGTLTIEASAGTLPGLVLTLPAEHAAPRSDETPSSP